MKENKPYQIKFLIFSIILLGILQISYAEDNKYIPSIRYDKNINFQANKDQSVLYTVKFGRVNKRVSKTIKSHGVVWSCSSSPNICTGRREDAKLGRFSIKECKDLAIKLQRAIFSISQSKMKFSSTQIAECNRWAGFVEKKR